MKPQASGSRLVWIALVLTIGATIWVSYTDTPEEVVSVAAPKSVQNRMARMAASTGSSPLSLTRRQPITTLPGDLFSTDQPDQQELSGEEVIEPTVPPLPFKYAGRLIEGRVTTAFLMDNQQNLLVHAGDIIGGTWRVEAIGEQQIHLTYIPLKTTVTLSTGEEY